MRYFWCQEKNAKALFGWLAYGELLDSLHILGIIIIIGGGIIMMMATKNLRK